VHRCGGEAAWWEKAGLDPLSNAQALAEDPSANADIGFHHNARLEKRLRDQFAEARNVALSIEEPN
jgi:hypothetical protein